MFCKLQLVVSTMSNTQVEDPLRYFNISYCLVSILPRSWINLVKS